VLLLLVLVLLLVVAPHVERLLDLVDDARHGGDYFSFFAQEKGNGNGIGIGMLCVVGDLGCLFGAGIYRRGRAS
jgi:hypothetical protein